MLLELEDDLVHLPSQSGRADQRPHVEDGGDGLDQDRAADRAARDRDVVLGKLEDVVPQARLEVVLHLRQVEVRAEAALDGLDGVVEEVQL